MSAFVSSPLEDSLRHPPWQVLVQHQATTISARWAGPRPLAFLQALLWKAKLDHGRVMIGRHHWHVWFAGCHDFIVGRTCIDALIHLVFLLLIVTLPNISFMTIEQNCDKSWRLDKQAHVQTHVQRSKFTTESGAGSWATECKWGKVCAFPELTDVHTYKKQFVASLAIVTEASWGSSPKLEPLGVMHSTVPSQIPLQ